MFWASLSSAASAAAMVSSTARSDAVTGRAFLRLAGASRGWALESTLSRAARSSPAEVGPEDDDDVGEALPLRGQAHGGGGQAERGGHGRAVGPGLLGRVREQDDGGRV